MIISPATARPAVLSRYLALYATLYLQFGVASPFLPALLDSRGLGSEWIGLALAAGTAVRLLTGPAAGRIADRLEAPRAVFAGCAAAAALAALGYLPAHGLGPLLAITVCHAAMLAPLAPVADALALGAAAPAAAGQDTAAAFAYGWVRGAGSAAFILGTVLAGQAAGRFGIVVVAGLQAALLLCTALCALRVPPLLRPPSAVPPPLGADDGHPGGSIGALLRLSLFRRTVLVAALILGSHAMHDSFAVIRWGAAGITPGTAGLLWSESVAAEVVMFLLLGRPLLDRLGPAGAATLAATAGALRWSIAARTAWLPALALIQPLHGITFALLHLACMRLFAEIVPPHLAATALTLYGTVGVGATTALLTLVSGPLYSRFGADGFWVMGALCAAAVPLARTLRPEHGDRRRQERT
jgi:PPP family 3-phenylpropionic acid transporter